MRVIAGTAGGRPLVGPAGPQTRPTSDKVKGALFSMLETLLVMEAPGTRPVSEAAEPGSEEIWERLNVLDLYAGTGALGIEALSRGAAWCDFVDVNAAARRIVERNLAVTGFVDRARLFGLGVEKIVRGAARERLHAPYGLVVMDPPYNDLTVLTVIDDLATSDLLVSNALVAVEHSRRVALADDYHGLAVVRERRYGDTVLSIYRNVRLEHPGVGIDGHDGDIPRHF